MSLDFAALEEIIHELGPPLDNVIIEDFVENLVDSGGRNRTRNRSRAYSEEIKLNLIEYTRKYKERHRQIHNYVMTGQTTDSFDRKVKFQIPDNDQSHRFCITLFVELFRYFGTFGC